MPTPATDSSRPERRSSRSTDRDAPSRFPPGLASSSRARLPSLARRAVACAGALALFVSGAGCRPPRAAPLPGAPVPARLPSGHLPDWHQRFVFDWSYEDAELSARGEGVARVAPPDSARLDLFLAGGFGSGSAFLLGDAVTAPGGDMVRRFLPPPPVLWAAFGRLAVPAAPDTTATLSGDTLRADIGRDPTWRVTFVGDRLAALDRIETGRVVESVVRAPDGDVRYDHRRDRRALVISVTRAERTPAFDASIWRP